MSKQINNKYKIPLHVKNYCKQELYDYKKNKNMIENITKNKSQNEIITRSLLIATQRINQIENVLNSLCQEEKEIVEVIFFKKSSQAHAELYYYISKDAYYNMKNKMLYLTAIEFQLV